MNKQWKLVNVEPTQAMLDAMTTERKKGNRVIQMWFEAFAAAPAAHAADNTVQRFWADEAKYIRCVREADFDAWVTRLQAELAEMTTFRDNAANHMARIRNECTSVESERDRLQAENAALQQRLNVADQRNDEMQSDLTKARELFVDMLKHTDGPGDFKWPVTMWFPAIRKLIANQSAPAANFIACKVDESCGQDAETAKGGSDE